MTLPLWRATGLVLALIALAVAVLALTASPADAANDAQATATASPGAVVVSVDQHDLGWDPNPARSGALFSDTLIWIAPRIGWGDDPWGDIDFAVECALHPFYCSLKIIVGTGL